MTTKYKGKKIDLGGKDYVFAPLTLASVMLLEEDINKLSDNAPLSENIRIAKQLAEHSLKRNYPELSSAFLDDNIDLGNFRLIIEAVMGLSGFDSSDGAEGEGK